MEFEWSEELATLRAEAGAFGRQALGEGVEDDETWSALDDFGCEFAQGYHLSEPLPLERFVPWLGRYEATRRASISA